MYQDHQANISFSDCAKAAPMELLAPLRVGLIGLGTVGAGTYNVLRRNTDVISARTGRRIGVSSFSVQ